VRQAQSDAPHTLGRLKRRPAAWPRERPTYRPPPWLLAGLGFSTAFFAVTWPLLPRFGHATYGGPGDGWALIWQTRFRLEHGLSYFSPTYGIDVGWPVGGKLTSSLLLSNASVELPNAALLWLGVGDVPAYNLVVFAAAVTSSLAMYAVLRRLGCRPAVAFWGGLVYLLAPWHLVKLSIHPTLASMAALPLLLLGIVEWARRPSWRSGALVVGAATLATYTHSYYGVATAITLLFALPIVLVAAKRRGDLRRVLPETALLSGVLVLVPIPLAVALGVQSSEVSVILDRPLYVFQLAARARYWLMPSVDNPVFGDLSRRYLEGRGDLNDGELALYLGFLTLALAVVALGTAIRRPGHRLATAVATAMALGGVVLSLPGFVHVPVVDATVRMPVAYVNDYLTFISTPARFFALTLTGTVVLGAFGLEYLTSRVPARFSLVVVAVACAVSAVELPFHRAGMVVDTRPTPLVRAIERRVPPGHPVAQYPSTENFYLPIARQLFYQVDHKRPLLNGAPATSIEDSVRLGVEDPSDPATPHKLALLGFQYAAYDLGQAYERALLVGRPVEEALSYKPPKGFRILERTSDGGIVMRIDARPAGAFVSIGTGFTRVGRWMTKREASLVACATAPGLHTLRFNASAFGVKRSITIGDGGLLVIDFTERPHIVRVHLRTGWQRIRIRLLASEPIRPSDVIPGEPDSRPLAVSIGPISVSGPRAVSDVCGRPTRLDQTPTIG
jgi:hypothetical protein